MDEFYLVVPKECKIIPEDAIREEAELLGSWANYKYVYINLLASVELVILEYKNRISILKKNKDNFEPKLVGGKILPFFHSKSKLPVYTQNLPDLVFSINEIEDVYFYGIRIDYTDDSLYYPIQELVKNIKSTDIYIPLKELGKNIWGECNISLIFKQNIVWNEKIIVIPKTEIFFDKEIYFPKLGRVEKGEIRIISDTEFDCIFDTLVEVKEKESNIMLLDFDISNVYIIGKIKYQINTDKIYNFEFLLEPPCICWRKNDENNWTAEVRELWHEDIGEIQVKLPYFIKGEVFLILQNEEQKILQPIKDRIVIFSLKQFSDSLRESTDSLCNILIGIEGKELNKKNKPKQGILLSIRMKWEIANLEIMQKIDETDAKIRIINMKWEELGKPHDKILRFWPLEFSNLKMFEISIPKEKNDIEIRIPMERLPAGRYRLHFEIDDPWKENEIVLPPWDAENCFDELIGTNEEKLQDIYKKGLMIDGFEYRNKKFPAESNFWIKNITLVPEFEGEERFQGDIYKINEKGELIFLQDSPVSFYFESKDYDKLSFLLDKDKDGVMYCIKCKSLYWDQKLHYTCEKQKQVIFPYYIHVSIRRS